jgi:hypothetical protein
MEKKIIQQQPERRLSNEMNPIAKKEMIHGISSLCDQSESFFNA